MVHGAHIYIVFAVSKKLNIPKYTNMTSNSPKFKSYSHQISMHVNLHTTTAGHSLVVTASTDSTEEHAVLYWDICHF